MAAAGWGASLARGKTAANDRIAVAVIGVGGRGRYLMGLAARQKEGYMIFSRRGYFQTYLGANEEEGPGMRGGAGAEEHVRNFLDCVQSGNTPNAGAEAATRAARSSTSARSPTAPAAFSVSTRKPSNSLATTRPMRF